MAKGKRTNPVVLRHGMVIGTGNAETDDEFLFDCFVHYPPVDQAARLQSPGMVLSGRTGSGKTAIIRYIQTKEDYTTDIDPSEMSMYYVANSDALRFLQAVGADIDLLFQVLWKHVLCIEFIRLKYKVDNEAKSKSIFEKLTYPFMNDGRKNRAIKYLREWEGKFWITADQNIKEITETVEKKLHAEFGADIEKFKAGGQYDKRLSAEKKSEIVARSRNIINAEQLKELHGIIEILSTESKHDYSDRFYIMIDKLDEKWVDEAIRFRLIRALLSSIKQFKAIKNLKILIALRSDILERVLQETTDLTFQREKIEDYFIKIKWTKSELKTLLEKRMRALFKRQYTSREINFDDVFTYKIKNKEPFDYIIERTHMRPRDVIAFVNECLEAADGQYEIAPKQIAAAEAEYSRKRRDALEDEWRSAFPTLPAILKFVGSFRKVSISLEELLSGSGLDDVALGICEQGKKWHDPLYDVAQSYVDVKENAKTAFAKNIFSILYRTGAVGLKLNPEERFLYAYMDDPLVPPDIVGKSARLRIHPMLHGAFRLSEQDGQRRGATG